MENLINVILNYALTHFAPETIKTAALGEAFTMGFQREENGNWYADIKQWPGAHAQLLMVGGADTFLDAINAAENLNGYVKFKVMLQEFDGGRPLVKTDEDITGATYLIPEDHYGCHTLWLCNVNRWVFGKHPDKIWYQVVL